MAPRTTSVTEDPPRRSTRISALPKDEVSVKAAGNSRKRAANEESWKADKTRTNKKVKPGEEANNDDGGSEDKVIQIDIGDALPTITLKNEKDEDIQIADLASEKGVVLFLVPKADTPGCTIQACGFRDIYPDFTSLNYDVYCLSADTPTAQSKWQTKKELPYPLISDPKRTLIAALGAADGGKTKRSHFIFEKGGKLVNKRIPVKPVDSPKLALEFIKSI